VKNILITGAAGFIGYNLTKNLIEDKEIKVFGIDSLNSAYDNNLKKLRLKNFYEGFVQLPASYIGVELPKWWVIKWTEPFRK